MLRWLFTKLKSNKPRQRLCLKQEPEKLIKEFLNSLFGYSATTVKTYRMRLLYGYNCFLSFLKKENVEYLNNITIEQLESYIELVKSHISDRTANGYVTSIRQFFKYLHFNGYIKRNVALHLHLPGSNSQNTEIEVIRPELVELLLNTEYGINSLVKKRNSLIIHFLLKTGMTNLEIVNAEIGDIDSETLNDLTIISVIGKRGVRRDYLLDPKTTKVLNEYIKLRGAHLTIRGVVANTLILSNGNPGKGFKMASTGVSAVVRRFLRELQANGCRYNLEGVNPLALNRTAKVNDWEPQFIQKGKEVEYIKLKEGFLREDKGYMNKFRVIKEQ